MHSCFIVAVLITIEYRHAAGWSSISTPPVINNSKLLILLLHHPTCSHSTLRFCQSRELLTDTEQLCTAYNAPPAAVLSGVVNDELAVIKDKHNIPILLFVSPNCTLFL